jgi:two-component system cell cycle sensor histidine kinase/response regulator CckA
MSLYSNLKTTLSERSQGIVPAIGPTRYHLILLHSLVTIVLCYQLLFSKSSHLPALVLDLITVGLLATIAALALVPIRLLGARWFVPVLVIADTGLTIASIYLSGNASSNLYVTFL